MGTNKERTAEVLKVLPFRKPSNQATDDVIARHAELPLLRRGEQQRASAARTRFDAQARNTQTTHICLRLAGKQGTTGTQQRCYLETRERARWKFHISSSLGSRDSFVLLRHLNGFIFSKHSPNHCFFFRHEKIVLKRDPGAKQACVRCSIQNINNVAKYDIWKFPVYNPVSVCAIFIPN